jgi:hypothetical protein
MNGHRICRISRGQAPDHGRLIWEREDKRLEGTYTESPAELAFQQLSLDLYLILGPGQTWHDGPCLSRMVHRLVPHEAHAVISHEDWEDTSRFMTDHHRSPLPDWRDGRRIGVRVGGQFTVAYSWPIVAQPAWGPIISEPLVHELHVVDVPRDRCIRSEGADVFAGHGNIISRGYTYFVSD